MQEHVIKTETGSKADIGKIVLCAYEFYVKGFTENYLPLRKSRPNRN